MITVQVKTSKKRPVSKSILIKAAQVTLDLTDHPSNTDVSIVVGNDKLLHELNLQYRGVDASTDVLSFVSGEIDPDSSDLYLGDVIISLPQAQQQAASEKHPLEDEMQLLVVHGVLHLLGYDHIKTSDKKQMQAIQDTVIKALALDIVMRL
ncbi:MAG TPA: rRNA maturation RNase YbeY [Anaerolineales bacterium]|nr:rRNA maturation RNase YbeY [Anaerolineales bacterium]